MSQKYITNYKEKKEVFKRRLIGFAILLMCVGIVGFLIGNKIEEKSKENKRVKAQVEARKNAEVGARFSQENQLFQQGLADEGKQEWAEAIKLYKTALEKNPNQPKLWLRLKDIYYVLKEPAEAAVALKNAIELEPNKSAADYIELSEIYQVMKQPLEALNAVEGALKLDPFNVDYLHRQALIATEARNLVLAQESYKKILAINPGDEDAVIKLKEIESLMFAASHPNTTKLSSSGLEAEGRGAWDEAITIYTRDLEENPNQPEVWKRIADIENSQKHYSKAAAALVEALKYQLDNTTLYFNLGETYIALKEPEKAIEIYNEALQREPNHPKLWKIVADLENSLKHYSKAAVAFIEAIRYQPNNLALYLGLGETYIANKEPEKAIDIYSRALTIKPNQPDVWKTVADLENSLKNYSKAALALIEAIKYNPNNVDLYLGLADTYAASKEPKKAFCIIEMILKQEPNNIKLLLKRAAYASESEYYDKADGTYQYILCLDPNNRDALLGIAQLLTKRNWLDRAVVAYNVFLTQYPDSGTIWIDYAKIHSWRGNYFASFKIIEIYRQRYGETREYWAEKSRLLAMSAYPTEALCIADTLLLEGPEDYETLFTKALALHYDRQPCQALKGLDYLYAQYPDKRKDTLSLTKVVETPLRSIMNMNPFFYYDNQHIHVAGFQVFGDYFLNAETKIKYSAKHETLRAVQGSGLETFDGYSSIFDAAQTLGITTRLSSMLEVGGLIGSGEIQRRKNYCIYEVNTVINPNDILQIGFQKGRNLYSNVLDLQHGRSLYAISPRSVSLGILQNYNRTQIIFRPWSRAYIIGAVEYDTFSDSNKLQFYTLSPRVTMLNSQYVNIEMGMYNVWYSFAKRLNNGYYSPRLYRLYQATGYVVLKASEDFNIIVSTAVGRQKDETMPDFEFAGDISLRAVLGIFNDWQLTTTAIGIVRKSPSLLYKQYTFEVILSRRF